MHQDLAPRRASPSHLGARIGKRETLAGVSRRISQGDVFRPLAYEKASPDVTNASDPIAADDGTSEIITESTPVRPFPHAARYIAVVVTEVDRDWDVTASQLSRRTRD